jgi:hypothetical protein
VGLGQKKRSGQGGPGQRRKGPSPSSRRGSQRHRHGEDQDQNRREDRGEDEPAVDPVGAQAAGHGLVQSPTGQHFVETERELPDAVHGQDGRRHHQKDEDGAALLAAQLPGGHEDEQGHGDAQKTVHGASSVHGKQVRQEEGKREGRQEPHLSPGRAPAGVKRCDPEQRHQQKDRQRRAGMNTGRGDAERRQQREQDKCEGGHPPSRARIHGARHPLGRSTPAAGGAARAPVS